MFKTMLVLSTLSIKEADHNIEPFVFGCGGCFGNCKKKRLPGNPECDLVWPLPHFCAHTHPFHKESQFYLFHLLKNIRGLYVIVIAQSQNRPGLGCFIASTITPLVFALDIRYHNSSSTEYIHSNCAISKYSDSVRQPSHQQSNNR